MQFIKKINNLKFSQLEVKNFNPKFLEDDYQIMGFLGQGSTSRVFMGYNILKKQKVVIKLFKNIPQEKILREIRFNNKINSYFNENHKNDNFPFIRLLDVIRNKGCGSYGFIFQFFSGAPLNMTPVSLIKQNRLTYMKQILEGLKIIHEKNIVNRDLKPANILITSSQGAKLFDFGLSKQKGLDKFKTNRFGTKCYYTPQVIFKMPEYDQKLDIWVCGLIFSQLISLKKPILPYKNEHQTLNQIINFCDYKENEDQQVINDNFKKFINKINGINFEKRMKQLRKMDQIMPQLNNEQFNILIQTVAKMLKINPSYRPSAKQVLQNLQKIFKNIKK